MKKKLIAVAIAGALSPMAALADSANVTIYGTFNMDFEFVKATGATGAAFNVPTRSRVSSNSSNIGFKGTETLGNGLSAFFQIESQLNPDDAPTTTQAFGNRNSGVGLSGSWGTVMYGRWDSPYKLTTLAVDPFGGTMIAGYNNIFGTVGYSASNDFDRRTANGVQYWSPNWSGFSFRAAYGANETKSNSTAAVKLNPFDLSIAGTYSSGPLYISAGWEEHKDGNGGATTILNAGARSKNTGQRLGVSYKFGNSKIGGVFERLEYESDDIGATLSAKVKRNAFGIAYTHQFGNDLIRFFVGKAQDLKGNTSSTNLTGNGNSIINTSVGTNNLDNTGATMLSLGYVHAMSKRTELYASINRISNKNQGAYTFAVNSLTISPGADPTGLALGIRHTF